MAGRALSTLLIIALCLQATLAGVGSSAQICLGGGHEHAPTEVEPESCERECEHGPAMAEDDGHEQHCGCVDVRVGLSDLCLSPRTDNDNLVPLALHRADPAPLLPTWRSVRARAPLHPERVRSKRASMPDRLLL